MRRSLGWLVLAALVTTGLGACDNSKDEDLIVLLVPGQDADNARWLAEDRPAFEAALRTACATCVVEIHEAGGSATTQRAQFARAVKDEADVVVLAAVTSEAGEAMVAAAGETPVIAYDRFVAGADYFVSVDYAQVGTLQAQGLLDAAGPKPSVLVLNGAATDPNAAAVKLAARTVLDAGGARVLAEVDPVDTQAGTAQAWTAEQLEAGKGRPPDAVYAATDAQAAGVVQALTGPKRATLPVITGGGADLAALQRIVTGRQSMTVYASIPRQAEESARIAVDLVLGAEVSGTKPYEGVASVIFEPVGVTLENLTDTVVRDGGVTISELCSGDVLDACVRLGIA
ncbi:putative Solute-binding protein [metagenome]|uniref:Putative Solute-binding protein n=1 Tax=metagenome TaxID=256318 RepID=A0A2P2CBE5_9ZZZZ